MSNEKDTQIQVLKIENNYLHHKIQQLFHEIKTCNITHPLQEPFKSRCETLYKSYQVFSLNGTRHDAYLPYLQGDDGEPE
jgi:hypothetical protein